jgi:hypothetical protein
MYSDMSRRTIAVSSSNRNEASALVSSVLPTPVGPRNMNEPIGRFGSCRPARARRTAVETASTASAWPTTRLARLSSMRSSFSFSPSSILSTGTPVQRDDHLRDMVRRHRLFDHAGGVALGLDSASAFSSCGISP